MLEYEHYNFSVFNLSLDHQILNRGLGFGSGEEFGWLDWNWMGIGADLAILGHKIWFVKELGYLDILLDDTEGLRCQAWLQASLREQAEEYRRCRHNVSPCNSG